MFKIFPCTLTHDGRKIPLISNWQKLATNDVEQIQKWSEQFRERITHWGVPTGAVNDLLVLDIDIKKENGWKTIQDRGLSIPDTLAQKTISGGSHFLYSYPKDGRQYGNRVGIFPGIDVRGENGYIFFYGVNSVPKVDPPAWLLQEATKPVVVEGGPSIKIAPEVAVKVIQTCLEAIREAPAGESNNVLNIESFKLGQLVASGAITREQAEIELLTAARSRGKPDYEAKMTIHSGLNGGSLKPLTSPFGSNQPVPLMSIPPPPEPEGRWTPPFLTMSDLLDTSKLRKPQLFQDWSTEDISITTADGGTGKTTLKLYEAVCLALGQRFLSFDCKQAGKTLFITGEDTDKKLAAMLGAIIRQMGLFENFPGNNEKIQTILSSVVIKKDADMCIVQKDRNGFFHPNIEALRKVQEAIHDIRPKMVVFDPISSFWGSEAALNDMSRAVIKFMSILVDQNPICIEIVNHMGKQSSNNKDMSQFAGRGGTALPSHARVSRSLRVILEDEFKEMTGEDLGEHQRAMLCNVNKFTDGSPLFNKPFLVLREGYLFTRKTLTASKARDVEKALADPERVFTFLKDERRKNKYPTKQVIVGHFMIATEPLSEARTKRALDQLQYHGHMGEKVRSIDHPDVSIKEKAYSIFTEEGREV